MEIIMTQEDKQSLLKDISARLPYGVKCYCKLYDEDSDGYPLDTKHDGIGVLCTIYTDEGDSYPVEFVEGIARYSIEEVKPYLRPMLSMTNEELNEYRSYCRFHLIRETSIYEDTWKSFDYLNSHYFDYRGLIEDGLALEAPEGMY